MNWDDLDIKKEISLGEDSTRQFKRQLDSASELAKEMCAFSNSNGGIIYVGVANDNTISGITQKDIGQYNTLISNTANENIKPAIYPETHTVDIDGKMILLIQISAGPSKPYCTSSGVYYVKSGSDKRKSSPEQLRRMLNESKQITLDETPTAAEIISGEESKTIDLAKFYAFYDKSRGKPFLDEDISITQGFENMGLAANAHLTLAGLLLFGLNPQRFKPLFLIRAYSFYGNEKAGDDYKDKIDCLGSLEEQFRAAMSFLKNNLRRIQVTPGSFNQPGTLEISEKALEEAVVNALMHRDYSQNAPINLFVFENRVEIISPGSLPNHLTVANIINGKSVARNPTIVSFATKNILPYSGIGSGIIRILKNHPETILKDDKDGEQFTITFKRPLLYGNGL